MGFVNQLMTFLFGSQRNVIVETAQVFRENSENAGVRSAALQSAALAQFGTEFTGPVAGPRASPFTRLVDGLNRLPRPMMAFGTIGLFVVAMYDPDWFAARMQGLSLVPEPLWWLMGAIVSFYFGARHQAKGQEFQHSIAATLARASAAQHQGAKSETEKSGHTLPDPVTVFRPVATQNAALRDWQAGNA